MAHIERTISEHMSIHNEDFYWICDDILVDNNHGGLPYVIQHSIVISRNFYGHKTDNA